MHTHNTHTLHLEEKSFALCLEGEPRKVVVGIGGHSMDGELAVAEVPVGGHGACSVPP